MSVEICNRRFFCTTSGVAFGPLMGSDEAADAFRVWLGCDPRELSNAELQFKWEDFKAKRFYTQKDFQDARELVAGRRVAAAGRADSTYQFLQHVGRYLEAQEKALGGLAKNAAGEWEVAS